MKALLSILSLFFISGSLYSKDWVDTLSVDSVNIVAVKGFPKFDPEEWIRRGHKNFINLSFWGSRGPVGRLVISGTEKGIQKKSWPIISLRPGPSLIAYNGITLDAFSGSNLLVKDSIAVKAPRSFFAKRNCPRTAVGILSNGDIVVLVTERSTLKQLAEKMLSLGSVIAINVDGGGSSLFVKDGEILWPQGDRRGVPVILSWKKR
jgi:hypothetical protein